jgi:hypothetical protein
MTRRRFVADYEQGVKDGERAGIQIGIEAGHTPTKLHACSESEHHSSECWACNPYQGCGQCGTPWPCDAARGAASIKAMLKPYRGHSKSCFCAACCGQNFSFIAGAAALGGK